MPFRFRKSVTLAKGLRLNLGKRGPSLSVGGKGASINISERGTRTTVGIPGSGISYSETSSSNIKRDELYQLSENRVSALDYLSMLLNGLGLVGSIVSFIGSCIIAAFLLYFMFFVFFSS
jgi:hypothetical protein